MLAGLEGGDGDLGVRVPRRADVDEVDVRPRHEGLPVGLDVLPVEAARHLAGGLGVTAADGDEVRHEGRRRSSRALRQPWEWATPMNA